MRIQKATRPYEKGLTFSEVSGHIGAYFLAWENLIRAIFLIPFESAGSDILLLMVKIGESFIQVLIRLARLAPDKVLSIIKHLFLNFFFEEKENGEETGERFIF